MYPSQCWVWLVTWLINYLFECVNMREHGCAYDGTACMWTLCFRMWRPERKFVDARLAQMDDSVQYLR